MHLEKDGLNLSPFASIRGIGVMYSPFGDDMRSIMDELNGALVE